MDLSNLPTSVPKVPKLPQVDRTFMLTIIKKITVAQDVEFLGSLKYT